MALLEGFSKAFPPSVAVICHHVFIRDVFLLQVAVGPDDVPTGAALLMELFYTPQAAFPCIFVRFVST